MNGGFPKEESRGGRGAKRMVRDVRGELGLGAWGRLPSSLVTSLGEGGLLAGGRSWITFPDAIRDGDHAAVSCMIGREETASKCVRGGLDSILGKISSPKELSSIGTGCPGKGLIHHP